MTIEQKAAETLLDRGIKVRVTAPLCLRVFGKGTVDLVFKQPYLGTMIRHSRFCETMQISTQMLDAIDEQDYHFLIINHGFKLAKIAANCWLNGYVSGALFCWVLAKWMLWKLTPAQLYNVAYVLVSLADKKSFTNTIRLVQIMTILKPNLSQEDQGS